MPPDVCALIGRRIRQLRTDRSMTQEDLAARADILQANLSRIENGKAEPGLRTLYDLAAALELTVSQMLDGVE